MSEEELFFEDKRPSLKRDREENRVKEDKRVKKEEEDEKDEEELELERELFGGGQSIIQNFGNDNLFSSSSYRSLDDDKEEREEKKAKEERKIKKDSVWQDEDDEEEEIQIKKGKQIRVSHGVLKNEKETVTLKQYEENLRNEFKKKSLLRGDWADVKSHNADEEGSDEDEDEEIQRTTISRIGKTGLLESGELNIERVTDANNEFRSKGIVSVRFHPKNALLSVGSKDSKLSLFQIDGKKNPIVSKVVFTGLRISSAEYGLNAQEILLTGNNPWIYSFDLSTSTTSIFKDQTLSQFSKQWEKLSVSLDQQYISLEARRSSHVHLLSNKTKKLITKLTMSSAVTNTQFSPDGNYLTCSTEYGDIFKWDLRTRKCIDKSNDNGQLTRSLAYSNNGSYFATGSGNGIVQVYRNNQSSHKLEKPIKSLDHMVTEINEMRFNPDSQILATRSQMDSTGKNSFRLYHVPSFQAFSNFPSQKKFGFSGAKTTSFDFSANGGFLATASDKGRVSLFRLLDYNP